MTNHKKSFFEQVKIGNSCKDACVWEEYGYGFYLCKKCKNYKWESNVNIDRYWKQFK